MNPSHTRSISLEKLEERTALTTTLIIAPPADPVGVAAVVRDMPETAFEGLATAVVKSDFVVLLAIE